MLLLEFVEKHGLTLEWMNAAQNNIDGKTPFKYTVLLKDKDARNVFITEYTKGAAHVVNRHSNIPVPYSTIQKELSTMRYGERMLWRLKPASPQILEVLQCLQLDAQAFIDNPLWEDFASAFGYNPDSIKDHKVFDACQETYGRLRKFFGGNFEEFLACEQE